MEDLRVPGRPDEEPITAPATEHHVDRQGFLPFPTNAFDRVFISVVCFIAIGLFWLRFVEFYIPLYVGAILSLILAVVIIRKG